MPREVIRATEAEKQFAISSIDAFYANHEDASARAIQSLKQAAVGGENIFGQLMEATKVCSLGQLSAALYEVGGQYRRSM